MALAVAADVPDWMAETGRFATVRLPVRWPGKGFAVAATVTVPLPVPPAPEVTVRKTGKPVTTHWQPAGAVTSILCGPPACGKLRLFVDRVAVQPEACWVTARAAVPMATEPVRAVPVFLATVMARGATPGPWPLVTLIQDAVGVAVHAQAVGDTTLRFAEPPAA